MTSTTNLKTSGPIQSIQCDFRRPAPPQVLVALRTEGVSWAIKYGDLYPSFVGGPEDWEDDTSDSDSLSVGLSHDPDTDLNTCDQ
ncbi:hypothetical protein GGX14DRAFT_566526 [Mycena pura]|uniref:Uncharacterized protein n=1 Tax=Mycena pura TaxID=153505 RepID=A0AAD6VG94_9AGAR|nr:hypothetical protein GGX14DRAFT_566526 [Mycena pura]